MELGLAYTVLPFLPMGLRFSRRLVWHPFLYCWIIHFFFRCSQFAFSLIRIHRVCVACNNSGIPYIYTAQKLICAMANHDIQYTAHCNEFPCEKRRQPKSFSSYLLASWQTRAPCSACISDSLPVDSVPASHFAAVQFGAPMHFDRLLSASFDRDLCCWLIVPVPRNGNA